MNPDKTYTYNPEDFKWTMDDIVTETTDTSLPGSDLPREVKPLPFFWWLNPWKHMELLFDAYKDHAETANAWRARYHLQSEETERQRQQVYDLQNELETVKAERDAANDAVRTLRKKGKRRG